MLAKFHSFSPLCLIFNGLFAIKSKHQVINVNGGSDAFQQRFLQNLTASNFKAERYLAYSASSIGLQQNIDWFEKQVSFCYDNCLFYNNLNPDCRIQYWIEKVYTGLH